MPIRSYGAGHSDGAQQEAVGSASSVGAGLVEIDLALCSKVPSPLAYELAADHRLLQAASCLVLVHLELVTHHIVCADEFRERLDNQIDVVADEDDPLAPLLGLLDQVEPDLVELAVDEAFEVLVSCLLYTSPSPRDA